MGKLRTKYHLVGGTSVGLLALLALVMLTPVQLSNAAAVEPTTKAATTSITTEVASVISVALQTEVEVDVTPRSNGSFATSTAELTVATNNESGYALYLKTVGDEAALKNTDTSNPARIDAIAETKDGIKPSAFADNTWGYNLSKGKTEPNDTTRYHAVPTESSTAILNESETTMQDDYSLTFGTKINTSLPAGTYNNSITVSVVANPITVSSLNQLVYMQDMSTDICRNTAEGVTKQLVDTRDGNSYWVAKLKDGNCWMTQNLALDITEHGLSATNTDIAVDWNEESEYPPSATNAVKFEGEKVPAEYTDVNSWDMGRLVSATPLYGSSYCNAYGSTDASMKFSDNLTANCGNQGFLDISDPEWRPTFTAQIGDYRFPNGNTYHGLVAVDAVNKTYDAHYTLGNYYQFNAATAGTGAEATAKNSNASGSICPKNWSLPVSEAADDNRPIIGKNGSFYELLKAYGYPNAAEYDIFSQGKDVYGTPILSGSNIMSQPIYMLRSGFVFLGIGYMRNIGRTGYYISSTSYSSQNEYINLFNESVIYPLNQSSRLNGYTVRCVAQGN